MQAQLSVAEPPHDPEAPEADHPLRVVIAYNEIAAGKRAMRVISDLGRELGEDINFLPFPWSFELLADTDWGEVAAGDAVRADILIIATSSTGPLPPAVGRWTEAAITRKQGTAAAVIALFGPEENPDGADSSRLEAIKHAARQAGVAFFAPTPHDERGPSATHPADDRPGRAEPPAANGRVRHGAEAVPGDAGTKKNATSFRDRFCQTMQCAPAEFTNRVFLLSLYFHALPVAVLLWPWRRRVFAADHAMIETVGGAQWRGDVQWKLDQMRTHEWLGGPGRRLLRCRISTRRLATLMTKVMRSAAES